MNKQPTWLAAFFVSVPAYLWQILFLGIPLLVVAGLSLISVGECGHVHAFTFSFFSHFLTPLYGIIIGRSLLLAVCNAVICLMIAYPLAYFLAFKVNRFKYFFLFLLILPFWTNFLLHVYAWFFVLERGGVINTILISLGIISSPLHLLNSYFSIMLMMVYYYLPFMALPLYVALEKFDYRLIEASLDLGATWWQTCKRVMIPVTFNGIISGFFLVFVPSFAEFAIPELMGGDKYMFAGSVVSYFILGGTTISYGAAFTILSSLVLVMSAMILYLAMKKTVKLL